MVGLALASTEELDQPEGVCFCFAAARPAAARISVALLTLEPGTAGEETFDAVFPGVPSVIWVGETASMLLSSRSGLDADERRMELTELESWTFGGLVSVRRRLVGRSTGGTSFVGDG